MNVSAPLVVKFGIKSGNIHWCKTNTQ